MNNRGRYPPGMGNGRGGGGGNFHSNPNFQTRNSSFHQPQHSQYVQRPQQNHQQLQPHQQQQQQWLRRNPSAGSSSVNPVDKTVQLEANIDSRYISWILGFSLESLVCFVYELML